MAFVPTVPAFPAYGDNYDFRPYDRRFERTWGFSFFPPGFEMFITVRLAGEVEIAERQVSFHRTRTQAKVISYDGPSWRFRGEFVTSFFKIAMVEERETTFGIRWSCLSSPAFPFQWFDTDFGRRTWDSEKNANWHRQKYPLTMRQLPLQTSVFEVLWFPRPIEYLVQLHEELS